MLYDANGKAYPAVVRKVFLTADEQGFLEKGRIDELPVFDTPAGRLGILICADAWFPESYARLKAEGVELLVVPSFITGAGKLATPWQGYSGAPPPTDVNAADVGRITLGAAWTRYAFAGRWPASGAHTGITSCLLGHLWDLGTDGQTTVVRRERPPETSHLRGEDSMVNLWLE